jgi:hypothetical protein
MTNLTNPRVRAWLLNGILVVLFGCAWASDRWPHLVIPLITVGVVATIGGALLLYASFKRTRADECHRGVVAIAAEPKVPRKDTSSEFDRVFFPEFDRTVGREAVLRAALFRGDLDQLATEWSARERRHYIHAVAYVRAARLRGSMPTTWAFAALDYDHFALALRDVTTPASTKPHLPELAKWKLERQGDDAFNIDAGAFQIEFFHGRTNIRVLDASQVTVEGKLRGQAIQGAGEASLVRPYKYQ